MLGLTEMLSRRAAERPEAPALVVDGHAVLTFGTWRRLSESVAAELSERGVRAGDRVLVIVDNRRYGDYAVAALGLESVGASPVPMTAGLLPVEVGRAITDNGAVGILCPPDLAPPESGLGGAWTAPCTPLDSGSGGSRAHDAIQDSEGQSVLLTCSWIDACSGPPVLRWPLTRHGARSIVLPEFDLDRLGGIVSGLQVARLHVHPFMARRLLESEAYRRYDLTSLREVTLTERPRSPGLIDRLAQALNTPVAVLHADDGSSPASVCHCVPTAPSQEGMLWYERLSPASFNSPPVARRLRGPLDVPALEKALEEVARRHAVLRSAFPIVDGRAVQVTARDGIRLEVMDLAGLHPADQQARVASAVSGARSSPFDLDSGPLFRPCLLRLDTDDHVLLAALHHSVWDDWSRGVFRRELSELYAAFVSGRRPLLPQPPMQFSDFCGHVRSSLAAGQELAERTYWRRTLAGAPLSTQLPIGGPAAGHSAQPVQAELSSGLTAALRALSRAEHTSLFMAVLAGFGVVVCRYAGEDDVVLATVVAGRDTMEVEGLIGPFAKKIPLRLRLSGSSSFRQLLPQVRQVVLDGLSHSTLAFEEILRETLGRSAARHGLVPQVGAVIQGMAEPAAEFDLPGIVDEAVQVQPDRPRHFSASAGMGSASSLGTAWGCGLYRGTFLSLTVQPCADRVTLSASGVFDRLAAERLLADLNTVLTAAVQAPDIAVDQLASASVLRTEPPGLDAALTVDFRGFPIKLDRMAEAISTHAMVKEAAVTVMGDDDEQRLVAVVVPHVGEHPTLDALRRHLWRDLPGYAWPATVVVAERLPRCGADLDATALATLVQAGWEQDRPKAPGTEEEATLAAIWAESSGVDHVAVGTDYWQRFSLLEVADTARRAGLPITVASIMRNRTIEALAAELWRSTSGAARPAPDRSAATDGQQ